MKTILLVAHGSKKDTSNDQVRALADRMSKINQDNNCNVVVIAAFLELAEPLIVQGIETCVNQGASQISVVPYFLSAGRHVVEDVPAEVEIGRKNHPEVAITLCDYLGNQHSIANILLDIGLK